MYFSGPRCLAGKGKAMTDRPIIFSAPMVRDGLFDYHKHAEIRFKTAKAAFRDLWNTIRGPDAWDANPWVVALTFDVHHGNIYQMEKTHD
jgi:hypothetical protein